MSLVESPSEPQRLEISVAGGKVLRSYLLKTPTVLERTRYRRAVAAQGGKRYGQIGLLQGLRAGVATIMATSAPELRDAWLVLIDAQIARAESIGEKIRVADTGDADLVADIVALGQGGAALAPIEADVSMAWPAYAQMVADDLVYWEIAGIEAARLLLTAWEGLPGEPVRDRNGTVESSLAAIPENDLPALGRFAEGLMNLSEQQRKNSPSPAALPAGGSITKAPDPTTSSAPPNSISNGPDTLQ